MEVIDIKYFNYCKRSGMLWAKSKRFLPNMNTTTNTKHSLLISGFRKLHKQGAYPMAKQVERKNDTPSCLSRWPVQTKCNASVSPVTTTQIDNLKLSYSNMNTLNIRKLIFVAIGFFTVVLFGAALIKTEGLSVVGETVGYLAALAIMALAATDNTRTKRLV